MSLQEIERSHMTSGTGNGFDREINESSKKMVLDILQNTQYTKPIESTVRELASNAVDSEKEKRIAIEILRGQAKVSDYFIERDGEQYKDSVFDESYYDLDYLNEKEKHVYLEYNEGKGSGYCDSFVVIDHGVGLGANRLKGYFQIGFSSKRNTINQLGAFGLGAKVSLSTGTPFYTVETAYNGRLFRFNCYSYNIESSIPKFDFEKEKENGKVDVQSYTGDPEKDKDKKPIWVYYEETDSKNYTKIITPTKRHHRSKYVQAVKNQLLYFKEVKFNYIHDNGHKEPKPFLAKVLHNSENLLISDTRQFSKPHVVVVKEKGSDFGVSYGTVDFEELEMETLRGSIGFKCPIRSVVRDPNTGEEEVLSRGVSVTPSRESVIWDEHTRAYIQEVIAGAQKEAEKIVQKELKETNIFPWFKKNSEIFTSYHSIHSRDSAFGVLSNIIDTSDLKIPFAPAPEVKFNKDPGKVLWPFKPRVAIKSYGDYNNKLGKREEKVERKELQGWGSINTDAIYFLEEGGKASKTKDLFLMQRHGNNPLLFQKMTDDEVTKMVEKEVEDQQQLILKDEKKTKATKDKKVQKLADTLDQKVAKRLAYRDKLWDLFKKDKTLEIKSYEEVEVPKTFEEKVENEEAEATLTPAEKRALENRVVLYTQYECNESYATYNYKMTKEEPKVKQLNEVKRDVIYGVQKDDTLLQMFALFHHRDHNYANPKFFYVDDKEITKEDAKWPFITRFSKRNLKYIKDNPKFKKAEDMVWSKNQKEINVGDYFIPFFTARYIKDKLHNLKFFNNFKDFNEELTEAYGKLDSYVHKNYSSKASGRLRSNEFFKDYNNEAIKVINAQLELRKLDKDDKDYETKKKAIIKKHLPDAPDSIESVKGLNMEVVEVLEELEAYSEPIKELFNNVTYLTERVNIPDEASRLLSGVIESENLDNFNLTENSIQNIENI